MKVSVVVPVYNALPSLQSTLQSLVNATDHLYELIIVDDCSDTPTQDYIGGLSILNTRVTKTRNPTHSWTNPSWNMGVKLATGDYITVINSDIALSPHWDTNLIQMLDKKHCSIACPMTVTPKGNRALDPLLEKIDPQMIQGAAFMFRRQETKKLFPIPDCLTHWYGDRLLSIRAQKLKGVAFCAGASITHAVTQSGKLIDPKLYLDIISKDLEQYELLTGTTETLVRKELAAQKARLS